MIRRRTEDARNSATWRRDDGAHRSPSGDSDCEFRNSFFRAQARVAVVNGNYDSSFQQSWRLARAS
jgi:hypothetical protein